MAIKSYIKHMSDMSGEKKNAHGGSPGKFGNTGNSNNVNQWRQDQMNAQREKDSQMAGIPSGTSGTGGGAGNVTNSATDWIDLIKSSGDYDNSYWAKPQNELLSNSRYAKSRDAEDRKTYLSFINDYKDQNPLETDWGKAIMSQYGLDGDVAAKNEWADAAASNGGNIDSFAEANARRQRLSYLNSGVNAVNEASNQRFSNMIGALEKMGVNTQQLLGISTSNAQSAMDAAKNRYSDDTTATVAYNNMVQKVLPSLMADNTAQTTLSTSERTSIGNALQSAYEDGGESKLLSTAQMLLANYGNDSGVEDAIAQYISIITRAGSSGTSGTKSKYGSFYPLMMFKEKVGENGEISDLPTDIQNKLRKEAEALGISATKYAKGLLTGDYTTRWLADIDPV